MGDGLHPGVGPVERLRRRRGPDAGPAPGAPTGVTAAAGGATSVHVIWNAVAADPGIGAYEVYPGAEKAGNVPGAAPPPDVVRLAPSTAYVFTVRVRARLPDGGWGAFSAELTVPTGPGA
ncbi:hypothetical protein C6376_38665 [Streptomyces sp. P3]|uniref:fibronectin type III domain-containing protein n=1 Tax=unclassified Streptomyces TaxID=2593676 RepID=UPI000D1A5B16|nr:fibronectin type III domain-containing protein [Streptomyces sp. ID05-04B]AVV46400.1 hypothetical protein C6376_38665 [Streptomyces sp. P3]